MFCCGVVFSGILCLERTCIRGSCITELVDGVIIQLEINERLEPSAEVSVELVVSSPDDCFEGVVADE